MSGSPQGKKKVAILGGGISALSAAFALTSPENPRREEYDVTIYQMGWRLGGKGASGRNMKPGFGHRVEEHGFHLFLGCYENAFRMMRACYSVLNRPPGTPLSTWDEAFKPQSLMVLMEKYKGAWYEWPLQVPTNSDTPGEGRLLPGLVALLETAIEWPFALLRSLIEAREVATRNRGGLAGLIGRVSALFLRWLGDPLTRAERKLAVRLKNAAATRGTPEHRTSELAKAARWFGREGLTQVDALGINGGIAAVLGFLQSLVWRIVRADLDDPTIRQLWVTFNFAVGNIRGALEDELLLKGLNSINHLDYRQWLEPRLVNDGRVTIDSPLGMFIYDAGFSYRDGDPEQPSLEAGSALRIMIRIFLTFKGALAWKMQAGMGDVIMAPLFQVLKQRGVKFEFFQRVLELEPNADCTRIDAIRFERQARLERPGTEYDPLVPVNGLPCWPAEPLYDQLDAADRDLPPDRLESYAPPDPHRIYTLRRGDGEDADFSIVILGIAAGGLPCVAPGILEARPEWRQMLQAVGTVRTQAFQVWMRATLAELGWDLIECAGDGHVKCEPPVMATYTETQASAIYADMAHILARETWDADLPEDQRPRDVAYFCGALPNRPGDATDWCLQTSGRDAAKAAGREFLERYAARLWPRAIDADGRFRWDLLVDAGGAAGPNRFDAQFFAGTMSPSDRYVQTLADSSRFRLRAGASGLSNLYLAGDWIDSTFNVGAVEAAVMAGLSTSNAMCGYPALSDIVGWNFAEPPGTP